METVIGFLDVEAVLRREYEAGDWKSKGIGYYDFSATRAVLYLADMLNGGWSADRVREQFGVETGDASRQS